MGMPKEELRRRFGLSTSTYVVIASMVGTGILVSPGYMMASLKNYPVIFGLWALGGLLALCGALCVAELAAALPRAGGEYVYLREAYGPMPAFLSGRSQCKAKPDTRVPIRCANLDDVFGADRFCQEPQHPPVFRLDVHHPSALVQVHVRKYI